jgi:uncharacterized protein YutE (UPF0331/DUF86 family)
LQDDFEVTSLGLVVAGLYSALESFCKAAGVHQKGHLHKSINAWAQSRNLDKQIDAGTFDRLRDLVAARHVFVHNRGVVDERFLRIVSDTHAEIGEFRRLDRRLVQGYADAVWRFAKLITHARESGS